MIVRPRRLREAPGVGGDVTADQAVRRAGIDGLSNLTAGVIGGIATLVLVLVVTRERGAAGAGAFFVSIALFAILSNLAELGADTGLLRSVPNDLAAGRRDRLVRTLRIALVPPLVVASAGGAALVVAARPVAALVSSGAAETADILHGLGGFLPFSVLATVALSATRGFGAMGPTIWIDRIARTLLQCAAVVLTAGRGGTTLGLAYGAPLVVAAGFSVLALHRLVAATPDSSDGPEGSGSPETDRVLGRQFWSFAGPRAVSAGVAILIDKIDVLLVAGLVSTAAAGVYSATTRLVVAGSVGATAVMQACQPGLTRMLARHRSDGARRVAQAATTWTMLVTWPVYGALALLAADVLPIFGGGFGGARDALVIVALASALSAGVGLSELTLLMSGGSRRALANTLAALVLNIGVNLTLIPQLGITGAAIAWALSLSVTELAAMVQVRWLHGFLPFGRSWTAAVVVVSLSLGVGYGMAVLVTDHGAARIGVFAATGVVVYLSSGWGMRRRLELPFASAGRGTRSAVTAELPAGGQSRRALPPAGRWYYRPRPSGGHDDIRETRC